MRKTGFMLLLALLAMSAITSFPAFAQGAGNSGNGAVFVMTNAADSNAVVTFVRAADGSLAAHSTFDTGGRGSGGTIDPLSSQGSLILSDDHSLLFAVNAGSGDISVFRVNGPHLERIDLIPSGGSSPVAAAQRGGLLYVLNVGGNDNVVGFRVAKNGKLERIPGSQRLLSNSDTGASGLAFSPDGRFLVVAERLNGKIDTFAVNADGTLSSLVATSSSGPGPFSVGFTPNGALLGTEAPKASISSYAVLANGSLTVLTGSLSTQGAAACWHATTPDGRFVYTSNAGTSTLSGFAIAANGTLTPVGATVVAANSAGSANLDLAITADGRFLYSLNAGSGVVGIFAIQTDGTLLSLGTAGELPAASGLNGIAAF